MPHVRGHYRNGRWVRPHYRSSPGSSWSATSTRRRASRTDEAGVNWVLLVLLILAAAYVLAPDSTSAALRTAGDAGGRVVDAAGSALDRLPVPASTSAP